jgi:signal transduction histidine kinase
MRRLFWKFFVVVWFTMSVSILGIVAINIVFGILPPRDEMQRMREKIVLDSAAQLLAGKGPDLAHAYVDAVARETVPTHVEISTAGAPVDCAAIQESPLIRNAIYAGTCYLLSASENRTSLLDQYLPKLLPWIAAIATSLGSAYLIARYLVGPVAQLRYGLDALARGDFGVRIGQKSVRRKDEITALAQDFDVTATRLQELHESQQRLFHDVSHELRSPLSRLQAAMGVLRKNTGRLNVMLPRMDQEIERMDALIEEILTLARLSSSHHKPLETQTFDVIDLINEIVGDASFEGQARGVSVTYQGVRSFVVRLNGELIYRAIENVIRNAVRYTADNSVVELSADLVAGTLRTRVRDHGPGVPQGQLDTIFEPFSRVSGNTVVKGHGLGLAIAKRALERQGGSVSAELHPLGGLVMILNIPVELNHAAGE